MDTLIEHMIASGVLHTPHIIEAFRATDRTGFVPPESHPAAHSDQPIHIGYQQTISQPSTVAFMLELLEAQPGDHVLDIGAGSGWTTALLAHIVGPQGSVLGLERIDELVEYGSKNLATCNAENARIKRAGTELGAPAEAPFNRILVSASARSFPQELVSQLADRGALVVPVRDAIWKATNIEQQPVIEKYEGYIFVPLVLG